MYHSNIRKLIKTMLTKYTKGNKTQDKGVIPFYTKEAFPSTDKKTKTKDDDDDSVKVQEENLVSLKLKIDETQEETKMNTLMSDEQFLSAAMRFEKSDKLMREKKAIEKEERKA